MASSDGHLRGWAVGWQRGWKWVTDLMLEWCSSDHGSGVGDWDQGYAMEGLGQWGISILKKLTTIYLQL